MPSGFGTPNEVITTLTTSGSVAAGTDLVLVDASAGAVTVTLYTPAGNYPNWPQLSNLGNVRVQKTDSSANPVTIATAAGSIIGQSVLRQQYQSGQFVSDGLLSWYNFGPTQEPFQIQKALAAADIIAMNGAPVTLVPAPGAGKIILPEFILMKIVRTATAFTGGGAVEYRYTNGSGAKVSADMSASLITGAAGTAYASVAGVVTELTPVADAALVITNATAGFAAGTGTANVTVGFRVVTA